MQSQRNSTQLRKSSTKIGSISHKNLEPMSLTNTFQVAAEQKKLLKNNDIEVNKDTD